MPELPEVETVKAGIAKAITGTHIKQVNILQPKLRNPIPKDLAHKIKGKTVIDVVRRAKYIQICFNDNLNLLIHLGMSGKVLISNKSQINLHKHCHLELVFDNSTYLTYQDPRRFGIIDYDTQKYFKNLGPEPFSPQFSVNYLYNCLQKRHMNIKNTLLDQKLVVGLGNIYVSEVLFLCQINPQRASNSINKSECEKIIKNTILVLEKAIKAGGTTLRDFQHTDGKLGYFKQDLNVYGKENKNCNKCSNKIVKIVQNNRSTYFCTICQG